MDKLVVELQDGYFVEIDSLNHTLRQRYAGQDKDGNEKESVRTIGYFGDMKQCVKALLERYPRELSEKSQISFDEYLELLDKAYTRSEQLVNSLGKGRRYKLHRESKERRRIIAEMENRQTRIPKHPNPDALRDFKEVPYQLRYGKEKKNAGI